MQLGFQLGLLVSETQTTTQVKSTASMTTVETLVASDTV